MSLWSLSGTPAVGVAAAKEPTDVPIQSHVDRPAQQAPSAATTQTLNVPPGFRVDHYAEGLGKPCMLAVSEEGNVYGMRREPGDLLMLGGTDGEGRAEVRKIVLTMTQLHGIALHGSWNRKPPSGYEVVMVRFKDGRPVAFQSRPAPDS